MRWGKASWPASPGRAATSQDSALDRASELPAPDYPYGPLGIDQRSRTLTADLGS